MNNIKLPVTIGNTPIVKLPIKIKPNVNIFAKLENRNLTGSIKDRPAFYMLANAENRGLLSREKTIIESSSGNTAIALAALSANKGYNFIAVVGDNISDVRIKLIKHYGADVIIVKAGTTVESTRQILKDDPGKFQMLDQYSNKMSYLAHVYTTSSEIIKDLPAITHLVAGIGTGGTIIGISLRLKSYKNTIQIVAVEPSMQAHIQGLRNLNGFIPEIYSEKNIDEHYMLDDAKTAVELSKTLGRLYGISAGPSSGAALWGAIKLAKRIKQGNILVIFPDGIEKYLE